MPPPPKPPSEIKPLDRSIGIAENRGSASDPPTWWTKLLLRLTGSRRAGK